MVSFEKFDNFSVILVEEFPSTFLQIGIYMDKMVPSNLKRTKKIMLGYLDIMITQLKEFLDNYGDINKKKKINDPNADQIITHFRKIYRNLLEFKVMVKSIDTPKFLKNFQDNKKSLKNKYTALDYLIEEEQIEDYLEEFAERVLLAEFIVSKLKKLLAGMQAELTKDYENFDKRKLIGDIAAYNDELMELEKSVLDNNLKVKIKGEIITWKNIKRRVKTVYERNYKEFVATAQILWKADNKIFAEIEAIAA